MYLIYSQIQTETHFVLAKGTYIYIFIHMKNCSAWILFKQKFITVFMPHRTCEESKYHTCRATLTASCTIIKSVGIRFYMVSTLKGEKTYLHYIDFTVTSNDFNFSSMVGSF